MQGKSRYQSSLGLAESQGLEKRKGKKKGNIMQHQSHQFIHLDKPNSFRFEMTSYA